MEEFYGKKYVLVNSEHFNDLLVFLDINFMQRQLAMTIKPVQYISKNSDGTIGLHFRSLLVNTDLVFTPGEEFDETKPGGVKVRSVLTIEGNKLLHRQVEANGRTLNHVYEFHHDKMVITTRGVGLDCVVKRYYTAVDK